ncbi:MAG: hypothetical protein HZC02_04820 [Candidatus Levybacteria bacterium]|nr:hypothetical protein [Candidatus Levybacteria bacterium]
MKSSTRRSFKKNIRFILFICTLIVILGIVFTRFLPSPSNVSGPSKSLKSPEIEKILATNDLAVRQENYKKLLERVGPVKAQEELFHSGIPYDGSAHLLNHEIGEWLYDKYSIKGIIYCKDYFLSSCYHGLLIEVIGQHGFEGLTQAMEACNKVSQSVAVQCAHGIGHGLLAWNGYKNLPKALSDCEVVAAQSKNFSVYNCEDGIFMENNWAVHEDGVPSPDRWVSEADPTYPCYDDRIAERFRKACWSNQPQVMYKLFQGNIDKIVDECENIKAKEYQEICFDSIARQINPVASGDPQKIFELCNKMPVGWKNFCVVSNVNALFSLGDEKTPFVVCSMIPASGERRCYELIQQRIRGNVQNLQEKLRLCAMIPKDYRSTQYCPQ